MTISQSEEQRREQRMDTAAHPASIAGTWVLGPRGLLPCKSKRSNLNLDGTSMMPLRAALVHRMRLPAVQRVGIHVILWPWTSRSCDRARHESRHPTSGWALRDDHTHRRRPNASRAVDFVSLCARTVWQSTKELSAAPVLGCCAAWVGFGAAQAITRPTEEYRMMVSHWPIAATSDRSSHSQLCQCQGAPPATGIAPAASARVDRATLAAAQLATTPA